MTTIWREQPLPLGLAPDAADEQRRLVAENQPVNAAVHLQRLVLQRPATSLPATIWTAFERTAFDELDLRVSIEALERTLKSIVAEQPTFVLVDARRNEVPVQLIDIDLEVAADAFVVAVWLRVGEAAGAITFHLAPGRVPMQPSVWRFAFVNVLSWLDIPVHPLRILDTAISWLLDDERLAMHRPDFGGLTPVTTWSVSPGGFQAQVLKLFALACLAPIGWKLPSAPRALRSALFVDAGALAFRAWNPNATRDAIAPDRPMLPAFDAGTARLFEPPDRALLQSGDTHALDLLRALRADAILPPGLVWRLGYALLSRGDTGALDELERLCRDASGQNPNAVAPHLLRAMALGKRGNRQAAVVATRQALRRIDDEHCAIERVAGLFAAAQLEGADASDRAVAALREAIDLRPTAVLPLDALDVRYREAGANDSRLEIARRRLAASRDPATQTGIHLVMAELHHTAGDHDRRAEALTRAAALCPDQPTPLSALADAQRRFGDPRSAIDAWELAADIANQLGDAALVAELLLCVADVWREDLQDTSRARIACRAALVASPGHAGAIELLARTFLDNDEFEGAIASLEPLVDSLEAQLLGGEVERTDARTAMLRTAYQHLARAQLQQGNRDAAAGAYRHLLRHAPDDVEAFEWATTHFLERSRPEEAIDLYRLRIRALGDDIRAVPLMVGLAELYEGQLGLLGDAARWIERACRLAPLDSGLMRQRIDLLARLGDHFALIDALIALADKTLNTETKAGLVSRAGITAMEELEDFPRAVALLERATALAPSSRELLMALRRALLATGDLDKTVATLERLARLTPETTNRRRLLVEAGDLLFSELDRPQRAYAFYREAQDLQQDPGLEARIDQIRKGGRHVPENARSEAQSPPTGPPTDVGPVVDDHDEWPEETRQAPESGLPEPVSEELEVTLLSNEPGRVGLHLISEEGTLVAGLPETTPTPSSGTPVAELPPFRPGSLAPADTNMVVASAESSKHASEASGRWTTGRAPTRAVPSGIVLDDDEQRMLDTHELDGESLPSVFGETDDRPAADDQPDQFRLPSPANAPDWRMAARNWTDGEVSQDTPADLPAAPEEPQHTRVGTALRARLEETRRRQDPEGLAELLAALIEEEADSKLRARYHQELGVLAYHELDDVELARRHLELALEGDPDGVGLEHETLAVLEAIYEDYHEYAELVRIYERKLKRGESTEMGVVYHLLIAQIHHEQLGDAPSAKEHVALALDHEPEHEGALRLLSEIHLTLENHSAAAEALEKLATLVPAGAERSSVMSALAEAHEHEGEAAKARDAWDNALSDADDPMPIIEKMKRTCRRRDDWPGLFEALLRELSIHLGRDMTIESVLQLDASGVPKATTVTVRHTVREMADVLSLKLDRHQEAWQLYGRVLTLSPEEPYALERRIDLGRSLEQWEPLARDLEQLSSMLLDPRLQFDALSEAARLYRDRLGDANRSRTLFGKAVSLFARNKEARPRGYDEASNEMKALAENVVTRVTLGSSPRWRMPTPPPELLLDEGLANSSIDPHDEVDVREKIAAIDQELEVTTTRSRRVELLTQKGIVLSCYPETQRDALISLRAALALEPNYVPARLSLVDGLLANGEVDQALNHLIVLGQRMPAGNLDRQSLAEIVSMVEVIVATGHKSVAQRAQTLLDSLRDE